MIASLPYPELHASVMAGYYLPNSGNYDQDAFTVLLTFYQLCATESDRVDQIADACDRRVAWGDLPLDLIAAYGALAELARWRAATLRGAT